MPLKTALFALLLVQSAVYGQTMLSKNLIDIKTDNYWKTVSNNDTLLKEYLFLDSLNFYAINYLSDTLRISGFQIEPKYGNNLPAIIFNRGGNREFGALTIGLLIEWIAPIAKEGYIIIASQYRGNSGSEGNDEFGGQDVNDVLNLIPIIDNMDRVDTARIGMYGWSRGGIMTYLALTRTTRIKAAIIGGAPTNLLTLLDRRPEMEKMYFELIPHYSTNKKTELINRSAIYFTDKLCKTTSYLILHGKNDWRVDYMQASNIVTELNLLDVRIQNVFYEGANHIINEHRADKDAKILSWLKQNL